MAEFCDGRGLNGYHRLFIIYSRTPPCPPRGYARFIGQIVDKLLEGMVIQVLRKGDADDVASPPANILDADDDVGFRAAPCIGKAEDVLEQFAFFVVRSLDEAILVPLEVESVALLLAGSGCLRSGPRPRPRWGRARSTERGTAPRNRRLSRRGGRPTEIRRRFWRNSSRAATRSSLGNVRC